MKRINSKGFTIVEVIIAMAILSVVVFVGYGVINGSNKVSDSQKHTSKNQLSTNLVNKYVSKDIEILEAKKEIGDPNIDNISVDKTNNTYKQVYTYTIDTINHDEGGIIVDTVEYIVNHEGSIDGNKLRGTYSVNRKSMEVNESNTKVSSDLELISNQKIMYTKDDSIIIEEFLTDMARPFLIDNKGQKLYTVGINYESNNKEKNYIFDVSPRLSISSTENNPPINPDIPNPPTEPPVYPEIDPDFDGNSAYIRFKQENGLAWSDAGPKGHSGNNYKGNDIEVEEVYEIKAKIAAGGNSGFAEAFLNGENSSASAQNKDNFPKGNYDQIKVSLYGDVIIENLTIEIIYKSNKSYKPIENKTVDKTQIIKIDRTKNGHDQNEIIMTGKMRLKEGSRFGDIIINLGHSKNDVELRR